MEMDKEKMLQTLFTPVELEYDGLVPIRWKFRGAQTWNDCEYLDEI